MWNYNYILPSFLVLVIFLGYYFSRPQLPIRINRAFLRIMVAELLVLFSDVLASLADEHYDSLPAALLYGLNMLYFVLFLLRAYLFFRFTFALIMMKGGRGVIADRIAMAVLLISEVITLSSFFTGAVFSITAQGYQKGLLYDVLYFCFFSCLILAVVLLLLNRKKLTRWEFLSALSYNLVLALGNVIRYLLPRYLVMNTFCLIAIIIIYLSFENPEFYETRNEGVFNDLAFESMLRELTGRRHYRILAFSIRNYNELREIYTRKQMAQITGEIGDYLNENRHMGHPYYLTGGRFALLGDGKMPLDDLQKEISERFLLPWHIDDGDILLKIGFVQMIPENDRNTPENVLNGLNDALDRISVVESGSIVMDADSLRSFESQTEVKRALEYAIENDLVEVFLQPLVDSKTEQVVGAEALARIRDANGKLIPPGAFIPLAEKNGRIMVMGEQVFEKVCRFISEHDIDSAGVSWINVNVSPIQCLRRDLNIRFSEILEKYQIPPEWVHLEITEESMIDYALLQRQIEEMETKGFRFVLDDYGTGYSNVARLKHCPFINVKLDMSVVWDYFHEPDRILPTLVETFKQMNFTVTAEGVESAEMASAMREIGCDYLQGFYYSKPVPMEEFMEKVHQISLGQIA